MCFSQCFYVCFNYSCPLLNVILLSFFVLLILCILLIWGIYFWKSCNNGKWFRSSVCVWECDCDGKIRYYDDNVDVIQLSWTDKNVTGCCAFQAWSRLEIWNRTCERIWNVQLIIYRVRVRIIAKVYGLLNSIFLVQYCLIHVYGSRLTYEYMK